MKSAQGSLESIVASIVIKSVHSKLVGKAVPVVTVSPASPPLIGQKTTLLTVLTAIRYARRLKIAPRHRRTAGDGSVTMFGGGILINLNLRREEREREQEEREKREGDLDINDK